MIFIRLATNAHSAVTFPFCVLKIQTGTQYHAENISNEVQLELA